jgi:hypothetical protein
MSSGGSSTTNTQDKEYNKGLLGIQNKQQTIAEEYFSFWQENQAPLEAAQAEANLSLVGDQTALQSETLASQLSLLPLETELAKTEMNQELALSDDKFDLAKSHMAGSQELLDTAHVNVEDRVGQATADVAGQFGVARADMERTASPYRSGAATNSLRNEEALAKAGGATNARRTAELDKNTMLTSALQNSRATLGGG